MGVELTGDDISRSLPILKPNRKSDIQIRNPESQDQSVLRKTQIEILLSV